MIRACADGQRVEQYRFVGTVYSQTFQTAKEIIPLSQRICQYLISICHEVFFVIFRGQYFVFLLVVGVIGNTETHLQNIADFQIRRQAANLRRQIFFVKDGGFRQKAALRWYIKSRRCVGTKPTHAHVINFKRQKCSLINERGIFLQHSPRRIYQAFQPQITRKFFQKSFHFCNSVSCCLV